MERARFSDDHRDSSFDHSHEESVLLFENIGPPVCCLSTVSLLPLQNQFAETENGGSKFTDSGTEVAADLPAGHNENDFGKKSDDSPKTVCYFLREIP